MAAALCFMHPSVSYSFASACTDLYCERQKALPQRHKFIMTVRTILKMGDARLLRVAPPVTEFDTDALHLLLTDLLDTMHAANGAGLAAPQIGEDLRW